MDQRIEDLEVRIAYLEKNISDLDGVVRALGAGMDGLRDEIKELRNKDLGVTGS